MTYLEQIEKIREELITELDKLPITHIYFNYPENKVKFGILILKEYITIEKTGCFYLRYSIKDRIFMQSNTLVGIAYEIPIFEVSIENLMRIVELVRDFYNEKV